MTQLDQFESVFQAASKEAYHFADIAIRKVLVISDLDAEAAEALTQNTRKFLSVVDRSEEEDVTWSTVCGTDFSSVEDLQKVIAEQAPDLVCTYRNLKSDAWRWPYSLGAYTNALVRTVAAPVLLLPHPKVERSFDWTLENTDRVLVVPNRLAGDDDLVNYGVRFCEEKGALLLAHIEDQGVFERYMRVIGKIPAIDTEVARRTIEEQLLSEARDFVGQCRQVIEGQKRGIHVDEAILLGHQVAQYKALVKKHNIDLMILHGDDAQHEIAMHGVSYSLAVELTELPILLL